MPPTARRARRLRVTRVSDAAGQPNAAAFDPKLLLFLNELKHPVREAQMAMWRANERRIRGGFEVLSELRPFDWETVDGKSITARRASATYINFGGQYIQDTVGHLFKSPPIPDFGSLGPIREKRPRNTPMNEAEQVWESVDSIGQGGTSWNAYWARIVGRAMTYGHMVGIVENTRDEKKTKGDELGGLGRPFVKHWIPPEVHDWYFDREKLAYLLVRPKRRRPRVDPKTGKLAEDSISEDYLLYVGEGYDGFGTLFQNGGFFRFDQRLQYITSGEWQTTDGEIPAWFLYYDQDDGIEGAPAISRPAVTELGQASVDYMNTSSAWSFDAWDAAKSIAWVLGIGPDEFKVAMDKMLEGSRFIPLFSKPMSTIVPSVQDSGSGGPAAGVFMERLAAIKADAQLMSHMEATADPGSSGVSKEIGHLTGKGPTLALLAQEVNTKQNDCLMRICQRWGKDADASVTWPERYDLGDKTERVSRFLEVLDQAGVTAARLRARAAVIAGQEALVIVGAEEATTIQAELEAEPPAPPGLTKGAAPVGPDGLPVDTTTPGLTGKGTGANPPDPTKLTTAEPLSTAA